MIFIHILSLVSLIFANQNTIMDGRENDDNENDSTIPSTSSPTDMSSQFQYGNLFMFVNWEAELIRRQFEELFNRPEYRYRHLRQDPPSENGQGTSSPAKPSSPSSFKHPSVVKVRTLLFMVLAAVVFYYLTKLSYRLYCSRMHTKQRQKKERKRKLTKTGMKGENRMHC